MRILLVEDDELLGSGLSDALGRAHYAHEWVRDGTSALSAATGHSFDLIILDLGLPGMDGLEVLARVRAAAINTPVLILSARDSTRDRVSGLNAGADDYLTKPFELEELIARVHVIERRSSGGATNRLSHGPVELDLEAMTVRCNGHPVELQRREFMLLKKLIENPNRIFTRDQLASSIYGWQEDVESNAIDVHVHHLRRKLHPEVVKTVRGVGYRIAPAGAPMEAAPDPAGGRDLP